MVNLEERLNEHASQIAELRARLDARDRDLERLMNMFASLSVEVRTLAASVHSEIRGLSRELSEHTIKAANDRAKMMWAALLAGAGGLISAGPFILDLIVNKA
jgi:hypothetical protein